MKRAFIYSPGDSFKINGMVLKVMAYADGYYMCRYKGCIPFVVNQKELVALIENKK